MTFSCQHSEKVAIVGILTKLDWSATETQAKMAIHEKILELKNVDVEAVSKDKIDSSAYLHCLQL